MAFTNSKTFLYNTHILKSFFENPVPAFTRFASENDPAELTKKW